VTGRPPARWERLGAGQIALLGAATAIGPLTVDLYLPALPAMAAEFEATPAALQLTLTAALVGSALGQLVIGPLTDRYGRRGPILLGTALYVLATAVCALAPSVPVLVAGRFLQGFLAAAAAVVTRAVLRDHVSGPALGRAIAGLFLVMGAGPVLAPALGSLLLQVTGWRGVFVALAGYAAVVTAVLAARLPESLPPEAREPVPARALARVHAALLADRSFLAPALVSSFSFAALFAWIAAGSFVLQGGYGLSETGYGVLFGVMATAVIGGSQLGSRLIAPVGALRLLRVAPLVGLAAAGALLAADAAGRVPLTVLVGTLLVAFLAVGVAFTVGATLALTGQPPHRAGLASGFVGVIQIVVGGAAAPLVGLFGSESAAGMAVVMVVGFAAAAAAGAWSRDPRPAPDTAATVDEPV
jgi:DHA1 family bicyclomycin/chloramphenicol resistance-like MFS transporter